MIIILFPDVSSIVTLRPENCLRVLDGVCEFKTPVYKAYQGLTTASAMDSSVLGYFEHPLISATGNVCSGNLDKLKLIWLFVFRIKPILANAPTASKILLVSIVIKSDVKIIISLLLL